MNQKLFRGGALALMVALAAGVIAAPGGCENLQLPGPDGLSLDQIRATAVEEDLSTARGTPGHGGASGPHWGFNIIGHPNNNFSGDNSNGHAIMVPLHTVPGPSEIVCDAPGDQTVFVDDTEPTAFTSEPTGAKIYFISGDHFEIIDRDALDNNGATIMVPTTDAPESEITFDIYLRVLGQPNTCMTIDAFAQDLDQNAWFWAGGVTLRRQGSQSKFVRVNELFEVFFCDLDETTPAPSDCVAGTTEELSVFNDVFESYFWNILNDGVRNVQVRLYPRD